jgi:hypothetical protein
MWSGIWKRFHMFMIRNLARSPTVFWNSLVWSPGQISDCFFIRAVISFDDQSKSTCFCAGFAPLA